MKVNKVKSGISLVVLIITIAVFLILTGIILLNIFNDNLVDKADMAVLRQDILSYQTELQAYIDNKRIDAISEGTYYSSSDDSLLQDSTDYSNIKKVIPSFSDKYNGVLAIKDGKLYYNLSTNDENILDVLNDLKVGYVN